jgi:hypothetical protein
MQTADCRLQLSSQAANAAQPKTSLGSQSSGATDIESHLSLSLDRQVWQLSPGNIHDDHWMLTAG